MIKTYLLLFSLVSVLFWLNLAGRTWCASRRRSRCTFDLPHATASLSIIEHWCKRYGYTLYSSSSTRRCYQRGSCLWYGAPRIEVFQSGTAWEWQLQAYVQFKSGVISGELALDEHALHPLGSGDSKIEILPMRLLNTHRLEFNRLLKTLNLPLLP
ncbi:hypothetical protein [Deefgea piscis]|uniref:hypothetical protein n=1 Tax=Deefgea piscis TaxID=2739061 RepID=UPI001C7EC6E7|nr:hypothetical protein [Deefgea piscis]QZA81469.1 hypothetical protein K4H25_02020 [Deefgea piscis]